MLAGERVKRSQPDVRRYVFATVLLYLAAVFRSERHYVGWPA